MSAPGSRVWQGIEAADPPCLRHDYPALLAMAEQLRDSRREKFPALVEAGKIAADEATRQIRLFEEIAADWRWICTGEGEAAPLVTIWDRRDALDESLRTIAAIAGKRGGFDEPRSSSDGDSAKDSLAHQAQCLIALRWHLEPERRTHTNAAVTHWFRARSLARHPASQEPSPKETIHA